MVSALCYVEFLIFLYFRKKSEQLNEDLNEDLNENLNDIEPINSRRHNNSNINLRRRRRRTPTDRVLTSLSATISIILYFSVRFYSSVKTELLIGILVWLGLNIILGLTLKSFREKFSDIRLKFINRDKNKYEIDITPYLKAEVDVICRFCGDPSPLKQGFCEVCGAKLESNLNSSQKTNINPKTIVKCNHCGDPSPLSQGFCEMCGHPLTSEFINSVHQTRTGTADNNFQQILKDLAQVYTEIRKELKNNEYAKAKDLVEPNLSICLKYLNRKDPEFELYRDEFVIYKSVLQNSLNWCEEWETASQIVKKELGQFKIALQQKDFENSKKIIDNLNSNSDFKSFPDLFEEIKIRQHVMKHFQTILDLFSEQNQRTIDEISVILELTREETMLVLPEFIQILPHFTLDGDYFIMKPDEKLKVFLKEIQADFISWKTNEDSKIGKIE
jgi:ribosomal protein L37E